LLEWVLNIVELSGGFREIIACLSQEAHGLKAGVLVTQWVICLNGSVVLLQECRTTGNGPLTIAEERQKPGMRLFSIHFESISINQKNNVYKRMRIIS
jgi:hypothetical protein